MKNGQIKKAAALAVFLIGMLASGAALGRDPVRATRPTSRAA